MSTRTLVRQIAVVAVLALLAMTLVVTATASAADWQRFDTDADALYDIAAIDRDGNGVFEDSYFDLDNDGAWDTNLYNTRGHDSFLEVIDFDMDENDEVEIRLRDADQRQGFDHVLVDLDQNGAWDLYRGRAQRIIPGSNIDYRTRISRHNASRDLMHTFRQRTGMSLLYPSIPACC